jgi:hypothetical protein
MLATCRQTWPLLAFLLQDNEIPKSSFAAYFLQEGRQVHQQSIRLQVFTGVFLDFNGKKTITK